MVTEIPCPYCQEPMTTATDGACCGNGHEFEFNFPALIANAKRELDQRLQVYPRLVAKGTLSRIQAEQLKSRQAETIVLLSFLGKYRDEFAEFLRQRGAAPAPPPFHDPRTEVIR